MKLIKLDAIDSTNDYLKSLCAQSIQENFTVVTAKSQSKGRGQMGASWNTEADKNLIMSVLIKDVLVNYDSIFVLNIAVAISILQALDKFKIPSGSIKWPNDIMSANKKVGGILIENSFKPDNQIESVVGIGLNINQTNYENLPKATSMKKILKKDFVIDEVLFECLQNLKLNYQIIQNKQVDLLWKTYHSRLFKLNIPMPFEDTNYNQFMGIIQGVTLDGKLQLILEDDSIQTFGIKEIQLLY